MRRLLEKVHPHTKHAAYATQRLRGAGACCALWVVYCRHFDKTTINYGIARPGFWLDAIAWWGLHLVVFCSVGHAVRQVITQRQGRKKLWPVLLFGAVIILCIIEREWEMMSQSLASHVSQSAHHSKSGFIFAIFKLTHDITLLPSYCHGHHPH